MNDNTDKIDFPIDNQQRSPSENRNAEIGVAADQLIGNKYRVLTLVEIKKGAQMFKVEQIFLGSTFALKVFDTVLEPGTMANFRDEAERLSQLEHPNLERTLESGLTESQHPYLVVTETEGLTLQEFIEQNGALSSAQVTSVFSPICSGLIYAHNAGVVHGNISAQTIKLEGKKDESLARPKLVDLRVFTVDLPRKMSELENQARETPGDDSVAVTAAQPNQLSDIYALGQVIIAALKGKFETEPADENIPLPYRKIVARLVSKVSSDQYQDCSELRRDLEGVSDSAPPAVKQRINIDPAKESQTNQQQSRSVLVVAIAGALATLLTTSALVLNMSHHTHNNSTATETSPQLSTAETKTDQAGAVKPLQLPEFFTVDRYFQPTRTYHFPKNSIGFIDVIDRYGKVVGPRHIPAANDITIRHGEQITYIADARFIMAHPEILKAFSYDDMGGLSIQSSKDNPVLGPEDNLDQTLARAEHLKLICYLNMNSRRVTFDGLKLLRIELKPVTVLILRDTDIDLNQLASLPNLQRLRQLSLRGHKNPTALLEAITGLGSYIILELEDCNLKDYEMRLISSLTYLEQLNVANNSLVTSRGLGEVYRLRRLSLLNLKGCNIGPADVDVLKKLRLNTLILPSEHWNKADVIRLSSQLPAHCRIILQSAHDEGTGQVVVP